MVHASDSTRLEDIVGQLGNLGHRGSASENENTAADLVVEMLREMGLEGKKSEFQSHSSYGARVFVHLAVASCGLATVPQSASLAMALTLLALFSFLIETSTRGRILSRLLPCSQSRNVSARVASKSEPKARVIVVAHLDTQRSGWIWATASTRFFANAVRFVPALLKCPLFPLTCALLLQTTLVFLSMRTDNINWSLWMLLAAAYGFMGILVAQWAVGSFVPGAIDNASGVAAAIVLAKRWIERPLPNTELIVLITGSEETGCLGAAEWLDTEYKYLPEMPTCFINLDTLGHGKTRILAGECALSGLTISYPPFILYKCVELADNVKLPDIGPHWAPTQTDGLPFLVRNVPGVTVTTFQEGFVVPNYHQPSDVASEMDFEITQQATEYAWIVLQALPDLVRADE